MSSEACDDDLTMYCPQCGAEYRPGFDRCPDCDRTLVDTPPAPAGEPKTGWEQVARDGVFVSGRRLDAEMVRGMLEAHGFDVAIWAGGMSNWRMESAITEMTGVPSPFNSYRVMVLEEEAAAARAILEESDPLDGTGPGLEEEPGGNRPKGFMNLLRSRWLLVASALFLLVVIILFGPFE